MKEVKDGQIKYYLYWAQRNLCGGFAKNRAVTVCVEATRGEKPYTQYGLVSNE